MTDYERFIHEAQTEQDDHRRHEAFSALVEGFQDAAVQWAYAALGDYELAQDAAQEAFVTAYEHLDQLRVPKAFPAWLKRIVFTHCNRLTRPKRLCTQPLDDEGDGARGDDPAFVVETDDLHRTLREAVRNLPDHERVVTELFYLTGYSQHEIAERLRLPITTVKKRLQYARERLKVSLPGYGPMASLPIAGYDGAETRLSWTQLCGFSHSAFTPSLALWGTGDELSLGFAASLEVTS